MTPEDQYLLAYMLTMAGVLAAVSTFAGFKYAQYQRRRAECRAAGGHRWKHYSVESEAVPGTYYNFLKCEHCEARPNSED